MQTCSRTEAQAEAKARAQAEAANAKAKAEAKAELLELEKENAAQVTAVVITNAIPIDENRPVKVENKGVLEKIKDIWRGS